MPWDTFNHQWRVQKNSQEKREESLFLSAAAAACAYMKERWKEKRNEGRKWRDYQLITSETGVNYVASSVGHILLTARLV